MSISESKVKSDENAVGADAVSQPFVHHRAGPPLSLGGPHQSWGLVTGLGDRDLEAREFGPLGTGPIYANVLFEFFRARQSLSPLRPGDA